MAPSSSPGKATTPPPGTAATSWPGRRTAINTPNPCHPHRPGSTDSSNSTLPASSSPTTTPYGNQLIDQRDQVTKYGCPTRPPSASTLPTSLTVADSVLEC